MNWLKKLWDWVCGVAKTLLDAVLDKVLERAKEIRARRELAALALEAVKAAAHEGLTGEKAWVAARDRLTAALKAAGIEVAAVTIDTTIQVVYDAWKALGYPED